MNKYIRAFKDASVYQKYLDSGNVYLPRVSYIPDDPSTADIDETKVYYNWIGESFIQVANGGQLYFTNTVDSSAYIDADGTLVINSPYVSIGENGDIIFNDLTVV